MHVTSFVCQQELQRSCVRHFQQILGILEVFELWFLIMRAAEVSSVQRNLWSIIGRGETWQIVV